MADNNRIDPVYGYIDNKVRSLKATTTRLRNRIENLEILDLQKQIISLDSRVKQLDSRFLERERDVAALQINYYLLWALWAFEPMQETLNVKNCIRFARESASSALAQVRTSKNPHQISKDWYSQCKDYFHKHGGFETFG